MPCFCLSHLPATLLPIHPIRLLRMLRRLNRRSPIPTCAGVDAVSDPRLNPGLVSDCTILLDSMDALRGTANLDWSASTTVSSWEGITLNASSSRVTELELDDEDLDGTIAPALGARRDRACNCRRTGGVETAGGTQCRE